MPGTSASSQSFRDERRQRVAIEHVQPELDGGRYPIKRVVGDTILVEADLFTDGHDVVGGLLRYRHERREY
ncbi:MAG: maltotransferase domain-containing protein, partial [Nitrospira sp.]